MLDFTKCLCERQSFKYGPSVSAHTIPNISRLTTIIVTSPWIRRNKINFMNRPINTSQWISFLRPCLCAIVAITTCISLRILVFTHGSFRNAKQIAIGAVSAMKSLYSSSNAFLPQYHSSDPFRSISPVLAYH